MACFESYAAQSSLNRSFPHPKTFLKDFKQARGKFGKKRLFVSLPNSNLQHLRKI